MADFGLCTIDITQWLFVLEQYAEFGLLFVLQKTEIGQVGALDSMSEIVLILTRQDLNNNEIESLTIEILKPKMKPFLITTWYRPPNSSIVKLKEFEKLLQDIDYEDKESIIMGDINIDISKDSFDTNSAELKFITDLFQYDQKIN